MRQHAEQTFEMPANMALPIPTPSPRCRVQTGIRCETDKPVAQGIFCQLAGTHRPQKDWQSLPAPFVQPM